MPHHAHAGDDAGADPAGRDAPGRLGWVHPRLIQRLVLVARRHPQKQRQVHQHQACRARDEVNEVEWHASWDVMQPPERCLPGSAAGSAHSAVGRQPAGNKATLLQRLCCYSQLMDALTSLAQDTEHEHALKAAIGEDTAGCQVALTRQQQEEEVHTPMVQIVLQHSGLIPVMNVAMSLTQR